MTTMFKEATDTLAAEAVFQCTWRCGESRPKLDEVLDHLAELQECDRKEARALLQAALNAGEVRMRWDADTREMYFAIDGSLADSIGVRVAFMKLWKHGLQPTDIYQGDGAEVVEAYQPLLVTALADEGIRWPGR